MLHLLLADSSRDTPPALIEDPLDEVGYGLTEACSAVSGLVHRVVPSVECWYRKVVVPLDIRRARSAATWFAQSAADRRRVAAVVGPGAAVLGSIIDAEPTLIAPSHTKSQPFWPRVLNSDRGDGSAWRRVSRSEAEAELEAAVGELHVVCATDSAAITQLVVRNVATDQDTVDRVVDRARTSFRSGPAPADGSPASWLDELTLAVLARRAA
jgi:hypothetical protein